MGINSLTKRYRLESHMTISRQVALCSRASDDIELEILVRNIHLEKSRSAFNLWDKLFDALERKGDFDDAVALGKSLANKTPAKYEFQEYLTRPLEWKGDIT